MGLSLVQKYNVPGPRYTSYPTVPYWDNDTFSLENWKKSLRKSFHESNQKEGISLYIHLPFCDSMCTFCGCHKRITTRHNVEIPYIKALLKEWDLYCDMFDEKPIIKELHLGGGTPTFFSSENLNYLVKGVLRKGQRAETPVFSFEGHPNNTNIDHLKVLYEVGFTRVSYGVQDYSPVVQKVIHRIQPFENVKRATEEARSVGYTSVGHDLIFGLPFQTEKDIVHTIEKTKELNPDRVALYSYAHVPWMKGNGQRGFSEENLPSPDEKRKQYELGKQLLLQTGYTEIGMDHFALENEPLVHAMENGILHRNFMGYTASKTQFMLGLGASAISDSWYGFAQNVKGIEEYQRLVEDNIIPVYRGHILNGEDLIIRNHILNLMCNFSTSWKEPSLEFDELPDTLIKLREMQNDGLLEMNGNQLIVLDKGKSFVRNVCMAFDLRLQRNKPKTQLFSMTV